MVWTIPVSAGRMGMLPWHVLRHLLLVVVVLLLLLLVVLLRRRIQLHACLLQARHKEDRLHLLVLVRGVGHRSHHWLRPALQPRGVRHSLAAALLHSVPRVAACHRDSQEVARVGAAHSAYPMLHLLCMLRVLLVMLLGRWVGSLQAKARRQLRLLCRRNRKLANRGAVARAWQGRRVLRRLLVRLLLLLRLLWLRLLLCCCRRRQAALGCRLTRRVQPPQWVQVRRAAAAAPGRARSRLPAAACRRRRAKAGRQCRRVQRRLRRPRYRVGPLGCWGVYPREVNAAFQPRRHRAAAICCRCRCRRVARAVWQRYEVL